MKILHNPYLKFRHLSIVLCLAFFLVPQWTEAGKAISPHAAPPVPAAITPNPLVEEMISQVSSSTLYTLVGNLSGANPVTIGGSPYTIATRNTNTDVPIAEATQYVYEYLQAMGLSTRYDNYSFADSTRRNVIAEQTGISQPGKIYLLIAHVDDTSRTPLTNAPGADDNASGAAAVLHIASILSQYPMGCTLRYALVTGEEQGLYGSYAYATEVYFNHDNLLGVLNLDMLGYNTPGSNPAVELDVRQYSDKNPPDLAIANLFKDVVSAYSIQLSPYILTSGAADSDHYSFWQFNYPAILAIEDWNDHTPYYHTTGDQLSTLNMSYYTEFVKAALATFAHMGCLPESGLGGTVRDQSSGAGISGARVEARQSGSQVRFTTTTSDGDYMLPLSPGSYSILVSAVDHRTVTFTDVTITSDQITQQDASLEGCTTVKGASFQVSTPFPEVGQTVSFSATVSEGLTPVSYAWDFGDTNTASGANASHSFSGQGVYPVMLTADNSCMRSQSVISNIYAGMAQIYLPIGMKNALH